MTSRPTDEVELDFTNVDRISQYLAEGAAAEEHDVELPVWHETEGEFSDLYAHETLVKALKLLKGSKVERVREDLYNVLGSTMYVTRIVELGDGQIPGVTCTCPNGANRSGRPTCYHSAAALVKHLGGKHPKVVTLLDSFRKKTP